MKLFIQIPCYNEQMTLAETLQALPDSVEGFDQVEILIVDDGSSDKTVEVAKNHGVTHIVSFKDNRGLAAAFSAGLDYCVSQGANVIINTDADNQYDASGIVDIVAPILEHRADMVVGARDINSIPHFSPLKKRLQKLGSQVVRKLSGTQVEDATSGFRAMTREVAKSLIVHSDYTYTLETLIQAGRRNFAVISVPIKTNPKTRESRLMRSSFQYVWWSMVTMFRIYTLYRPLRVFSIIGGATFFAGFLVGLRFLFYYFIDGGQGHIQSLILVAILCTGGFLLFILGVIADLLAANRRLIEDLRLRIRSLEETKEKSGD